MTGVELNDDCLIDKFIKYNEINQMQPIIKTANNLLFSKSNNNNGFLELPSLYNTEYLDELNYTAEEIQKNTNIFISLGIGGSYLGQRMAISFLNGNFYNYKNKKTKIFYAGNSLSGTYLYDLLKLIDNNDFSINVISKSGTTLETSIAFRIFKRKLMSMYSNDELKKHIFITTSDSGPLKQEAETYGYKMFLIPKSVGGRFSVLSPVGLLPIAVSGGNIKKLLQGANDAQKNLQNDDINYNDAYKYAAIRNILYRKGYDIELFESYEPQLMYFGEWWKQLVGESEGKDGKGIYPSSLNFTTDLHSIGQYIQDGKRMLMETVLSIDKPSYDEYVPLDEDNFDNLNYLHNISMNKINYMAYKGVIKAHSNGGVPVIKINVPKMNEYYLGYLIYFFELSISISGYVNGVNPFDQPGVEDYKKNMFELLKKIKNKDN